LSLQHQVSRSTDNLGSCGGWSSTPAPKHPLRGRHHSIKVVTSQIRKVL